MKKLIFISILAVVIGTCFTVSAFADFYVIPTTKKNYAPVEKSGETKCYHVAGETEISCTGTGQDGEYLEGVDWPNPRFTDNDNGTVTDNLTGLIWLKDANSVGETDWGSALNFCNNLAAGGSLTDGSSVGDWRLPNIKELQSLTDYGQKAPSIPSGYPFTGVQVSYYWSSTSCLNSPAYAWAVSMYQGYVGFSDKTVANRHVWPVRSDN